MSTSETPARAGGVLASTCCHRHARGRRGLGAHAHSADLGHPPAAEAMTS